MDAKAASGEVKAEGGTKPPAYPILQHMMFEHLPDDLKTVSQPFCELSRRMAKTLPRCAETSAGLRKLMEAKDCFVRAALEGRNQD